MKKHLILFVATICMMTTSFPVFAHVPHEIAGFALGKNIEDYQDRIRVDTVLPIRYAEYLKEVEIKSMPGFKSGLITYGDCASPGRILRIRLKYDDSRRQFYNELLKRFKKEFGKPDRWRGDPFHIVVAWKWSFTDNKGNRVSMILQHNIEDTTRKVGNVIKLSMLNFEEEERLCFLKKQESEEGYESEQDQKPKEYQNWEPFIPR